MSFWGEKTMKNNKIKKLQEAVNTIRDECSAHRKCLYCPFYCVEEECYLTAKNPEEWELATVPNTVTNLFIQEEEIKQYE